MAEDVSDDTRKYLTKTRADKADAEKGAGRRREIEATADLAFGCSRNGGFHAEFQPWNDEEAWPSWTGRCDWKAYGPAWFSARVRPLVVGLREFEAKHGSCASDMIKVMDRSNPAGRADRWAVMQAMLGRVLHAAGDPDEVRSVGREVGILMAEEPEFWEHYHSYFEAVAVKVRALLAPEVQTDVQEVSGKEADLETGDEARVAQARDQKQGAPLRGTKLDGAAALALRENPDWSMQTLADDLGVSRQALYGDHMKTLKLVRDQIASERAERAERFERPGDRDRR